MGQVATWQLSCGSAHAAPQREIWDSNRSLIGQRLSTLSVRSLRTIRYAERSNRGISDFTYVRIAEFDFAVLASRGWRLQEHRPHL